MPSGSRSFQKPPPKRPAAMCREAPPARAVCARLQPAHRPKRSVLPLFMTNPSPRHRRGGASGNSNPPEQRSAENHSVPNAYQETRFNEPDTSGERYLLCYRGHRVLLLRRECAASARVGWRHIRPRAPRPAGCQTTGFTADCAGASGSAGLVVGDREETRAPAARSTRARPRARAAARSPSGRRARGCGGGPSGTPAAASARS